MKTRNAGLTILAQEPEKAQISREDTILSIRTPEGELMTNRVRALLREYGDRIPIPASLMLEVLEDRNRKSSALKVARREISAYERFADEAIVTIVDLYDATTLLLNRLIDAQETNGLVDATEEVTKVSCAFDAADHFFDDYTVEEDEEPY